MAGVNSCRSSVTSFLSPSPWPFLLDSRLFLPPTLNLPPSLHGCVSPETSDKIPTMWLRPKIPTIWFRPQEWLLNFLTGTNERDNCCTVPPFYCETVAKLIRFFHRIHDSTRLIPPWVRDQSRTYAKLPSLLSEPSPHALHSYTTGTSKQGVFDLFTSTVGHLTLCHVIQIPYPF